MKKLKSTLAVGTLLYLSFFFSSCKSNDSNNAELESLRAENESLKSTSVETTTLPTTTTPPETTAPKPITTIATEPYGTYKSCTAVLEGATIVTDYKDEPAIIVEITFTNNSNENRSCGFTFTIDAFQDDIECETAIVTNYDEFDTSTNITDIKPGVSFTVYKAYKLRNESSDVVVEVSGLYDIDGKVISTKTYHF